MTQLKNTTKTRVRVSTEEYTYEGVIIFTSHANRTCKVLNDAGDVWVESLGNVTFISDKF